jgi:hypothetical protein
VMEIESAKVLMGFLTYRTGLQAPWLKGINLARE